MERLYITHYYYPGTDPWKNIILTAENNNYKENKTSQYYSITLSERKSEASCIIQIDPDRRQDVETRSTPQ